jgi:hypothetical protein
MTYEWAKDAAERFVSIGQEVAIENLQRLEEGFTAPVPLGPEQYFQEATTEIVENWRLTVEAEPEATYGVCMIADMLPFVATVHPRIGVAQSMFGLSLICLEGPVADVTAIVAYGLEPLLSAQVLTDADVAAITHWFETTPPTWDGSRSGGFSKRVVVGQQLYIIKTDDYRGFRDLNIQPE